MKKPYKKWLFPLLSLVCLGILAFILIQIRIWSLSRDHRISREEAQPAQAILILGAAFMIFGIWRGEMAVVFEKAVNICMECIGIG